MEIFFFFPKQEFALCPRHVKAPSPHFFSGVTYCGKNCKLQCQEKQQLAKTREGIHCLPKDPFLWEPGEKHFSDRETFWMACSLQMLERTNCDSGSFYKELVGKLRRTQTDPPLSHTGVCGCFAARQAGPEGEGSGSCLGLETKLAPCSRAQGKKSYHS